MQAEYRKINLRSRMKKMPTCMVTLALVKYVFQKGLYE